MSKLLEVSDLHVFYGVIHALKGLSLSVEEGQIVALIGANGAGKTTTLRAISGMVPVRKGSQIRFAGLSVEGQKPHALLAKGLAHAPEGRGIFLNLTVRENLQLGAYLRRDAGVASDLERCFGLFPVLKARERQLSGTLSGGEQQMLAISRALMSRPRLLLLDEPSLGLAPQVVARIFEILTEVNAQGVSLLLVEQNANLALRIAHRAYVLETGERTMEGTGKELLMSPEIRKAYLGE
jgi:branched-chain amino acid transport system ATP-binding protein